MKFYLVYKDNGLYDPVLDDYDPVYEEIDQDFDQPSRPTEVSFEPKQFTDLPENGLPYVNGEHGMPGVNHILPHELPQIDSFPQGLPDLLENSKLAESRSLTASPFVLPVKPYRPFSTEPINEIPPLEEPIILNPGYHDDFGKLGDEDIPPATRFKLPISEQYDPDGIKQKKKISEGSKSISEITKEEMKQQTLSEIKKEEKMCKEEIKLMQNMKKDIDMKTIEMAATSIVDESIVKAVTVAEEIKKEIEVVLSESESETESKKVTTKSKLAEETKSSKAESKVKTEVQELVDLIDKTTEDILKQNEIKDVDEAKKIEKLETTNKQTIIEGDREVSTKESIEEIAISDKTERKSTTLENKDESSTEKKGTSKVQKEVHEKVVEEDKIKEEQVTQENTIEKSKKINATALNSDAQAKVTKTEGSKMSTQRLLAEQRAYTIGLQTIPHIRGTIHSSYHYDLLLRTFFIHLTDVMVALSRFILTEPASQSVSAEATQDKNDLVTTETITETVTVSKDRSAFKDENNKTSEKLSQQLDVTKEQINKKTVEDKHQEKKKLFEAKLAQKTETSDVKAVQSTKNDEEIATIRQIELQSIRQEKENHNKQEFTSNYIENYNENVDVEVDEIMESRILSGSEMAQRSGRTPVELIQKMGTVISEFQNKAGIEDTTEAKERRSRSRSRVREKTDHYIQGKSRTDTKTFQESTEFNSTSTEYCNNTYETKQTRNIENSCETKENQSLTSDGKKTYIAIVEAHIYTNKDAILKEQTSEIKEVKSERNAAQTNIAIEGSECVSTEKVSLKNLQMKEEVAKSVIESHELATAAKKETSQFTTQNIMKNTVKEKEVAKVSQGIVQEIEKFDLRQATEIKSEITDKQEAKTVVQESLIKEAAKVSQETIQEIENYNLEETTVLESECRDEKTAATAVQESLFKEAVKVSKESVQEVENYNVEETTEFKSKNTEEKTADKTLQKTLMREVAVQEITEPVIELQETKFESWEETRATVGEEQAMATENVQVAQEAKIFESIEIKEEEKMIEDEIKSTTQVTDEGIQLKEERYEPVSADIKLEKTPMVVDKDEFAQLKVVKENITEVQPVEILKDNEVIVAGRVEIADMESIYKSFESKIEEKSFDQSFESQEILQESAFTAKSFEASKIQESSFTAKSVQSNSNDEELSVRTEINEIQKSDSQISILSDENNNTLSPTVSVPPTPLTEEYIFKLEIALPKGITPIPPDPVSPVDEDPHIVKKKLIPTIDTTLESSIIYDPSLPTPPGSKPTSPVYTKPGLRGGADRPEVKKEEILEIERKSSLLASAIDETIKSIEEYKEEVGIDTRNKTEAGESSRSEESNSIMYNGITTVVETKVFDTKETIKTENHTMKENTTVDKEAISNKESSNTETNTEFQSNIESTVFQLTEDSKQTQIVEAVSKDVTESAKSEENITKDTVSSNLDENADDIAKLAATVQSLIRSDDSEKRDPMDGYKPVPFDPEEIQNTQRNLRSSQGVPTAQDTREVRSLYMTETGEIIGTKQGIVDGLEEAVVDEKLAKELGKPGITDDKIAELISGEAEMLREAHVMGLSRVLSSHMHRPDDSSVDFQKIKPIVESLKDSEVLKALNEELLLKTKEEKKKDERKWTTFLQKPKRPVPRAKFGYHGYVDVPEIVEEPYRVKIVKQPKPKVAPDYKPEDFNTGLLPWEERALKEPSPPPVEPEEPILVPEEAPEILEAVDPLPESEIPDLEDSGIPLPPPKPKEPTPPPEESQEITEAEELDLEAVIEETEKIVEESLVEEMEQSRLAEQLISSVQNMVDPNAPLEQQLAQMRAQLAALAQLPSVIQQSLEMVTKQLSQLGQMESKHIISSESQQESESYHEKLAEEPEVTNHTEDVAAEDVQEEVNKDVMESQHPPEEINEVSQEVKATATIEEIERMRREEEEMLEEQRRLDKQKKELLEQQRIEAESRQVKQRATPRVGKPKPAFGPINPEVRPLVLPGGRKWRGPKDAYNEQFFADTLAAQAEIIKGTTKGINFMKYEKPPVSLDHLQHSEVYKVVHNMDQTPLRRVEMLTPPVAVTDYIEKCRSVTPCSQRIGHEEHLDIPQQVQP